MIHLRPGNATLYALQQSAAVRNSKHQRCVHPRRRVTAPTSASQHGREAPSTMPAFVQSCKAFAPRHAKASICCFPAFPSSSCRRHITPRAVDRTSFDLSVYLVTDRNIRPASSVDAVAKSAIAGYSGKKGVTFVQYVLALHRNPPKTRTAVRAFPFNRNSPFFAGVANTTVIVLANEIGVLM